MTRKKKNNNKRAVVRNRIVFFSFQRAMNHRSLTDFLKFNNRAIHNCDHCSVTFSDNALLRALQKMIINSLPLSRASLVNPL